MTFCVVCIRYILHYTHIILKYISTILYYTIIVCPQSVSEVGGASNSPNLILKYLIYCVIRTLRNLFLLFWLFVLTIL